MTNYVLLYKGGGVPATEEEQRQVMADWAGWYERLGQVVVDGGNPFGPSRSVAADGSASDGGSGMTGYSIVQADSLDAATDMARTCPHRHQRRHRRGLRDLPGHVATANTITLSR